MNKYIFGILVVSGLLMGSQFSPVSAAMTEEKANDLASNQGGSGVADFMGYCMSCHGMEGKGDGPLAEDIDGGVSPRDLSNVEYMSSRSDEELFNVIKNGGKSAGFSEGMPDWGYNFTDDAIRGIVQYIRSDLCKCKYSAEK